MFFSIAYAEEAPKVAGQQPSSILSLLPIVVLVFVFYFFIVRPQQKKAKEDAKMRGGLRIGDKIVTTSGIFGSIVQIDDKKDVVSIEISKGVSIVIYKSSIAEVLVIKEDEKGATSKN